jgi:hypothetical protein
MRRTLGKAALVTALLCAAGATHALHAATTQKLAAGEWFVQAPAKGLKDLPSLAAERDFSPDDTLGNIVFVCDRAKYYLLLIAPTFKFARSEPGTVLSGDGADGRFQLTFTDLYGSRAPLGAKFDRDAAILFTEVPKSMLGQLTDGGTLRVDLKDRSWSMALTGIAAKIPTFTTFCETGKRRNRSHFAK